jgi:hypothetical protein
MTNTPNSAGAEIFELIPAFPSMSSVRRTCEERERKSLFEEEMLYNEFAAPPSPDKVDEKK